MISNEAMTVVGDGSCRVGPRYRLYSAGAPAPPAVAEPVVVRHGSVHAWIPPRSSPLRCDVSPLASHVHSEEALRSALANVDTPPSGHGLIDDVSGEAVLPSSARASAKLHGACETHRMSSGQAASDNFAPTSAIRASSAVSDSGKASVGSTKDSYVVSMRGKRAARSTVVAGVYIVSPTNDGVNHSVSPISTHNGSSRHSATTCACGRWVSDCGRRTPAAYVRCELP